MIYVLDTNAVSALMKGNAAFVERLASHVPGDVAIPQPAIAEIAFGIERLPRSKRRKALQSRFDLICAEIPRTEWTDAVSHAYGRIKATRCAAWQARGAIAPLVANSQSPLRSWRLLALFSTFCSFAE